MKNRKNILLFAGLTDKKLISKISPILETDSLDKLYLIRREELQFTHPRLVQFNTPKYFGFSKVSGDIYRFIKGIHVVIMKKIDITMGYHLTLHIVFAYLLALFSRKKLISVFIESPEKYKVTGYLLKILRRSNLIGVRGSRSKDYLAGLGIDKGKIFSPSNHFELPPREKNRSDKKEFDLVYIGNFVPIKDLSLWVDVFATLKKKLPNLRGTMLGDGEEFELIKDKLESLGLENSVDLPGYQDNVTEFLERSKVLLMTSKSEGLPMVGIEAMSVGVPVVMPNVGDMQDLVDDGINGFLIKSRDSEDFAEACHTLLSDSGTYMKCSTGSVEKAKRLGEMASMKSLIKLWDGELSKL